MNQKYSDDDYSKVVIKAFKKNRHAYGTKWLKKHLEEKEGIVLLRRRIGRIMGKNGLVSSYIVAKYKVHKDTCNEAKIVNSVDRKSIFFIQIEEMSLKIKQLTGY